MEEEVAKNPSRGCSAAFWLVLGLVVLVMAISVGAAFVLEVPFYLAFGWVFFLKDNIMRMTFGWKMIASSALGLLFCLWLTHAFCRWVARQKNREPWRFAQTLRLNALVFLFFAASCALVGTVHQSIWLLSNPVVVNRSRNMDMTQNISKLKQIYLLLLDYEADHGNFPDSLQVLMDESDTADKEIFYATKRKTREPFLYFGKGLSTSENGGKVILMSPFLYDDRVAFLRVDGSARSERVPPDRRSEEKFEDLIRDGFWPERKVNPE